MRTHDIEAFLSGTGKDYKNRTLAQILCFSNFELESRHNYIQCLFPIDTVSAFAPAPIITIEKALQLRTNKAIQLNLHLATERMIRFYTEYNGWKQKGNHNYKRISRILRSLRLFGCDKDAERFYSFILEQINIQKQLSILVDEETKKHWEENNKIVSYE